MTEYKLNFKIERNHRITFLTGAGISAECGIPTFRGEKGLWEKVDIEELATPQGFAKDPEKVWQWYDVRRARFGECKPNAAHETIMKLEKAGYDVVVITQNIDNLHNEAGSQNVIELHGNVWYVRCTRHCGFWEDRSVPLPEIPPRCACGSLLRPHVVWFGEMLDENILSQAFLRCSQTDLCFVVGTSGIVQPAAGMSDMAKAQGAYVVEVNLEQTPITYGADESHFGKAGEVLPQLLGEYIGEI